MEAVDLVAEFAQPARTAALGGGYGSLRDGWCWSLTSGGIKVPLEAGSVRFLDKFSIGQPGATGSCSCTVLALPSPSPSRFRPQTWLSAPRRSGRVPSTLLSLEAEEKSLPGFAAAPRSHVGAELGRRVLHLGRLFAPAAGYRPGAQSARLFHDVLPGCGRVRFLCSCL